MGMFDDLTFEDGLEVTVPAFDGDPTALVWQSKSIEHHPCLDTYKVTRQGRLYREKVESELIPEEDRQRYHEDIEGFETEWDRFAGCIRSRTLGWTDMNYHGTFEFHHSIDGDYHSFTAIFTDGDLVEIERNGEF